MVQLEERLTRSGLARHVAALLELSRPSIRLSEVTGPARPYLSARMKVEVEVPVVPEAVGPGLEAVAAGSSHCLGLTAEGSVVAWGTNAYGQLGDGSRVDRFVPVGVVGLSAGVTAVAVSMFNSLALKADGSVVAWGMTAGPTPVSMDSLGYGVTGIAIGLALLADGSVLSWGFNNDGQLGDGCPLDDYGLPIIRQRDSPAPVVGLPLPAVAISSGGGHCLALLADGSVWAWGSNEHGQLGNGVIGGRYTVPVPVLGLEQHVSAIAAACESSYALGEEGSVLAWGGNGRGQLGDGTRVEKPSPVLVLGLGGPVREVSSFWMHCLALRSDGQLVAWGHNHGGQLGDGSTIDRISPVVVEGLGQVAESVAAVSTGPAMSFAFLAEGSVRGWGLGLRVEKAVVPMGADSDLALGATKLGGRPDLRVGTKWPTLRGAPLSFVAQVDLSQVASLDTRSALPSSGYLSFFYDSDHPDELDDLNPAGVVLFSETGSHLRRTDFPDGLAISHRYSAVPLQAEFDMTLPAWADPQLAALPFSNEESERYRQFLLDRDDATAHRLLGHPDAVQSSQFQPELCDRSLTGSLAEADRALDWALLAQFDSAPSIEMCWNDSGRLYYWIDRKDLAIRRFDRVWVIAQSR